MRTLSVTLATAMLVVLAACQGGGQSSGTTKSTAASTAAGSDGGIGASIGRTAGDDSASTLTGDVGDGIGYVIGDEADRDRARRMSQGSADLRHDEVAPLGGTRWKVLDIQPSGRVAAFRAKILDFRMDGRVITTTTDQHGGVTVADESYRVVGKTVIISKPGLVVNGKYWFNGNRMIVDGEDFRVTLLRSSA